MFGALPAAESAPRAGAVAAATPRTAVAIVLLLVLGFVLLRCIHLEADTPLWIGKYYARELFAEPPAKAHEARNYALFGTWQVNPADNYQFWRAQSPAWVYPLTLVFMTFGTDYPQLRVFATLYSALGFALALWLGARYLSRPALIFAGVAVAFDAVYFHYARVGMLEPAVNAWLALSMLALLRAEKHIEWLAAAHFGFALAFFTKQAALYALPVVALGSLWFLFRPRVRSREERLWRRLTMLHAVLLAAFAALYMLSAAYQREVAHNVNHVLVGDMGPQYRWHGIASVLDRLADHEKYRHFWLTVPITGTLALSTVCFWLVRLAYKRRLDAFSAIIGGWFVCACLAMFVIAKSELRYWTLMVMPAALVAASGLDALYRALLRADLRYVRSLAFIVLAVPFAVLIVRDARDLSQPLLHPVFTLRDGAKRLERQLGATDATIVGLSSPPLVLGTPYKNYYVRDNFNSTRRALKQLRVTHILLNDGPDISRPIFKRAFPHLFHRVRPELVIRVRNLRLMLYGVRDELEKHYPSRYSAAQ